MLLQKIKICNVLIQQISNLDNRSKYVLSCERKLNIWEGYTDLIVLQLLILTSYFTKHLWFWENWLDSVQVFYSFLPCGDLKSEDWTDPGKKWSYPRGGWTPKSTPRKNWIIFGKKKRKRNNFLNTNSLIYFWYDEKKRFKKYWP